MDSDKLTAAVEQLAKTTANIEKHLAMIAGNIQSVEQTLDRQLVNLTRQLANRS